MGSKGMYTCLNLFILKRRALNFVLNKLGLSPIYKTFKFQVWESLIFSGFIDIPWVAGLCWNKGNLSPAGGGTWLSLTKVEGYFLLL